MAEGQVVSFHQLKIKNKQTKSINQTKNNNKKTPNETEGMGSISCQAKNRDIAFIGPGTNP